MKLIKNIFIGLVALIAVLAAIGFFLPNKLHIERSVVIQAPPSTVFGYLNNFRMFKQWSPWAKLDPNTHYIFSGPESGIGAKMEWSSENPDVGKGSQKIIGIESDKRVTVALDFGDMGKATSYYQLQPENAATKVVWGFDKVLGYNPVERYFGLIMDRMVGPDFEKGLANLKTLVETPKQSDSHPAPVSMAAI